MLLDDHPSLAAAVEAGRPAYASLVPTQLHRMLDDADDVAALRSLRTVLLGGGPVDPALRSRAAEAGVRVVATYGSAETAGGCVYDGVALDGVGLATDADGRLRICRPDAVRRVRRRPGADRRVLVDGWFRTEDAAPDRRGRPAPGARPARRHGDHRWGQRAGAGGRAPAAPSTPRCAEVEVLGVPDAEWGTRLVAFVVGELDLAAARAWVAEVHPRSWAPRQLVVLEALPMLANGKVDRVQLATTAASS